MALQYLEHAIYKMCCDFHQIKVVSIYSAVIVAIGSMHLLLVYVASSKWELSTCVGDSKCNDLLISISLY